MRLVLWLSVFSFTGLFVLLLAIRRRQLRQEGLLADLERQTPLEDRYAKERTCLPS
jgi:hypothetical protein